MNWQEIWVVEYSVRQQCFHIGQLDQMLENNAVILLPNANWTPDFLPVALAESHEEAKKAAKLLEAKRDSLRNRADESKESTEEQNG